MACTRTSYARAPHDWPAGMCARQLQCRDGSSLMREQSEELEYTELAAGGLPPCRCGFRPWPNENECIPNRASSPELVYETSEQLLCLDSRRLQHLWRDPRRQGQKWRRCEKET